MRARDRRHGQQHEQGEQERAPHRSASRAALQLQRLRGQPVRDREPQVAAALGAAAGGQRGHARVVAQRRVERAEPQRPVRPAQALRRGRPARVSAQPSASAERTLGAAAQAARASATPRGWSTVVGLEQRQLDVGVHARAGEQRLLRAHQREVAAPGGTPAGGQLGLAERDHVLGQRQPLDDAAPAGDRAGQVAGRGGQARAARGGGRVVRASRRSAASYARRAAAEAAAGQLEIAEQACT